MNIGDRIREIAASLPTSSNGAPTIQSIELHIIAAIVTRMERSLDEIVTEAVEQEKLTRRKPRLRVIPGGKS